MPTTAKCDEAVLWANTKTRKDFLVEAKVLVNSVNDRTVLYLLADWALEACRTRKIEVAAFESWADKEKVAQILTELRLAKSSVNDEDRQEANRYRELRGLYNELTRASCQFLDEARAAQDEKANLVKLRDNCAFL